MKFFRHLSPRLSVEIEVDSAKEAFKSLSNVEEVFQVTNCGKCESDNIRPVVREVEGNNFFEMRCSSCGYRLSFSQSKNQRDIYPRRRYHKQHIDVVAKRAKVNDYLPFGGWERFVPTQEEE